MKDKQKQLDLLQKKIINTMKCPLKDAATNIVFGKGNPDAPIMFIGEAPGEKEDILGVPFVGAAGKRLDKLLSLIGLGINDIYIANILKYRPPKNRDPTKEEIVRHTPFLVEQIKIIRPKIIATLGNYSTKFVLSNFQIDDMKEVEGISLLHGKHIRKIIDGVEYIVIPLYHPAATMYRPGLRIDAENDFIRMKSIILNNK